MKEVRDEILNSVKQAADCDVMAEDLRPSPVADYGCSIAYKLAKKEGRSPQEIAEDVAAKIKKPTYVTEVSVEGAYINFHLNYPKITQDFLKKGFSFPRRNVKVVLEHTSANPTGPLHVGRIRSTLIGDSLKRILDYYGYDVETHYFVNDIGKQVAIIAIGLRDRLGEDENLRQKYLDYAEREDYRMFFTYVVANKAFEEDQTFQLNVQSLLKAAESSDKDSLYEITSAAKKCLSGQKETFERLHVSFDVFDFESEDLESGGVYQVMEDIRKDPRYRKTEFGEGIDLSELGIVKRGGMSFLSRADGTSVYLARDVAYHLRKLKQADKLVNVFGEDHKFEFREVKAILESVFKVKKPIEVLHFSFIGFEGMRFSTRKGEVATVDELLDEAVGKAQKEVEDRKLGDENTPGIVAVGAVKFHIVKTSPSKQIMFRWEDALSFEGDSAPYIQYAYARSCRIIEKANEKEDKSTDIDYMVIDEHEKKLILKLMQFTEAVQQAATQLRPDILANYLIELTGDYGRFYIGCPVLDSKGPIKRRRLMIVRKLMETVKTGLYLLGVEAPERM